MGGKMKFLSTRDKHLFLLEVERMDLIDKITDDFVPEDELIELFVKKRRGLVPKLKDFRRSQLTKEQWRSNRYAIMKGIKTFHRSTQGKRFHRNLGTFLATREFSGGIFKRDSNESVYFEDVTNVLKAVTSAKTHLFIEYEFYHPLDDEIDYQIFTEEALPALDRIEQGLVKTDGKISRQDLDFLAHLTERKCIINELSNKYNVSVEDICGMFKIHEDKYGTDKVGNLIWIINQVKGSLEKCQEKDSINTLLKSGSNNLDFSGLKKNVLKKKDDWELVFDGNDEYWVFYKGEPKWRSSDTHKAEAAAVWNHYTGDTLKPDDIEG